MTFVQIPMHSRPWKELYRRPLLNGISDNSVVRTRRQYKMQRQEGRWTGPANQLHLFPTFEDTSFSSQCKKRAQKIYREARKSDTEALWTFFDGEKLLIPTNNELREWIRRRELFVATNGIYPEKPIGTIRLSFAESVDARESLIELFDLSKPIKVLQAAIYGCQKQKPLTQVTSVGFDYQVNLSSAALFFLGSFKVMGEERGKRTAMRLMECAVSQYIPMLKSLWADSLANLPVSPQTGFSKIAVLFGTACSDVNLRRLAISVWHSALNKAWPREGRIWYLMFDHVRPDGADSRGHLLLFDISGKDFETGKAELDVIEEMKNRLEGSIVYE